MILKEKAGPYPKGTAVSRRQKKDALYVDPLRFKAWQDAGLLEEEAKPSRKTSGKKKAKGEEK